MPANLNTAPSRAEINKFIEMFERLDAFESSQRHIRGCGAFRPEEIPDTATIKVIAWLKELS